MAFEYGGRLNKGDYFSTKVDVENQTAETKGTIDGEPVDFSGGSYELIAEQEFEVNTDSGSEETVGTINLGAIAWTNAQMLYIKIRDKEGSRSGYYFGNDCIISNAAGGSPLTINFEQNVYQRATSYISVIRAASLGVYPKKLKTNGDLDIAAKYSELQTRIINSTYVVQVYLLSWPDDISPWVIA